mgnify:FL=1
MSSARSGGRSADLAARREGFRKRTEQYLLRGHDRLAAARFVAAFAGSLDGPVLDVGTGKGLLATALAGRGVRVVSIDPDDGDQALACLLAGEAGVGDRIDFVRGDAARLPFAAGRFGGAAMMAVLHHLHEPASVLRDMSRVVRTGGVLVVADFSEEGFELVSRVHREEGGDHPRCGITVDEAVAELERQGLRCIGRREGHSYLVAAFEK